jgi:DNA-binding transcriptional LysR family regulator
MVRGFAFVAESIQPHFEEPQGGAQIKYVLPRCPNVPLRVQFTGRGDLSMTLISTHQATFSTGLSSESISLTMGRALRADTLKDRLPGPRPIPIFQSSWGCGMFKNDTRLMESVIALAEELHFGRAARKLRISQPMLTKNIQDVEALIGGPLFLRDRKHVVLSDAGRAYVQQARLSLLYGERAVQSAREVIQSKDETFHVGRTPYADPFLVSTLLSIQLPLFPRLKVELVSKYSLNLIDDLLAGVLDLAIANEPPESPLLTCVRIAESPFYIAMSRREELARYPSVSLDQMGGRRWILFDRPLHPPVYDAIIREATQRGIRPRSIQHVTAPEEAFPFVADGTAIALVVKTGALLMARNGVTVRPLNESNLKVKTCLVCRADDDSKIASEFVRAYMRKVPDKKRHQQLPLPISAYCN